MCKVEETKQGVVGKLIRSPFKVMEDWQKIIKETDISTVNIPVSIGFMTGGLYRISYSLASTITICETYSECVEFINVWIKQYSDNKDIDILKMQPDNGVHYTNTNVE